MSNDIKSSEQNIYISEFLTEMVLAYFEGRRVGDCEIDYENERRSMEGNGVTYSA